MSFPLLVTVLLAADPLPGTQPLTNSGDLAADMIAGLHRYLDRELAAAPARRAALWSDTTAKTLTARRQRLRTMLGVVDTRTKPSLEYISGPGLPHRLAEIDGCQVQAVRWAVLPGIDADGLLIEPRGKPTANVVAVPHADQLPEQLAGLVGGDAFALRLARLGCRVLVPAVIDRRSERSGNPLLNRQTNIPHREFVYRMAFEMGRTLTGYEVQKVLAAVDWFQTQDATAKVGVIGYGDGGLIALAAGAVDDRIAAIEAAGCFDAREQMHRQPIDRNVWGLLTEFGDAEMGAMVRPGGFAPQLNAAYPKWAGAVARTDRVVAAPGTLGDPADAIRELRRFETLTGRKPTGGVADVAQDRPGQMVEQAGVDILIARLGIPSTPLDRQPLPTVRLPDTADRHRRQFDQLVAHSQRLWRDSDRVRRLFWTGTDASSPEAWEKSCDRLRAYFHAEVIGKLPEPTIPLNPRTRRVYDEPAFIGYEVLLDVYPDVVAQGILLLPKGLKPNERRPVVVCQHGLEGTPRSCIDPEKSPTYFQFARKLVERGYVVYCPQNPYIGRNSFRQLQRKANPLKLSLFSFIIRQHQRTLDWLETLPHVDKERIGFYGLSYGGKTAMRVPAVEKRYRMSICSGDFNEWVGKIVSVDLDRSYMWTNEYEMLEFDLGNTFNYAELAYLIAPRPFMVERGHDDPVGTDEMVASEYAKVRYLYANRLKLPDRTAIEFRPGGHRIFLQDTLAFLDRHLPLPR